MLFVLLSASIQLKVTVTDTTTPKPKQDISSNKLGNTRKEESKQIISKISKKQKHFINTPKSIDKVINNTNKDEALREIGEDENEIPTNKEIEENTTKENDNQASTKKMSIEKEKESQHINNMSLETLTRIIETAAIKDSK